MGRYFTVAELCRSSVAASVGINNTPPRQIEEKLVLLIKHILDPVREMWGSPLTVNSGYRCPALNSHPKISGAKNSQHMTGEAADITTGSREGNKKLFDIIAASGLPFDQLIDESRYSWIHISFSPRNRRQVLHL